MTMTRERSFIICMDTSKVALTSDDSIANDLHRWHKYDQFVTSIRLENFRFALTQFARVENVPLSGIGSVE